MATGTLGDLKARIASELRRTDLTSQIADAINDAITVYQSERLRFNEAQPLSPFTMMTQAGQSFYDAVSVPQFKTLFKFDYINVLIGNTYSQLLRRPPEEVRLSIEVPGTQNGQPDIFAFEGETLLLYPTPDTAYQLIIAAHMAYPAPANDQETGNRWMTDAELLIRSRAKYEIATHVTRNRDMAAAMSPFPPAPGERPGAAYAELSRLKAVSSRLVSRGRVAPMQF